MRHAFGVAHSPVDIYYGKRNMCTSAYLPERKNTNARTPLHERHCTNTRDRTTSRTCTHFFSFEILGILRKRGDGGKDNMGYCKVCLKMKWNKTKYEHGGFQQANEKNKKWGKNFL
ncbi:hypothetical protein POVWA2_056770 [Plasmodium ovale wallikeri]|uniref:Uncharacterized protein n=1 Tax=Plasmodium ovale wallikeri TaxID=864142 RepID=A0A1A8ZY22_PLAOA|nr:hypothetical protein POVWA1_057420 [Plasmodium ovale wallikeri]SBT48830.1 hypothetical protein POVWA2_056770 [Plasmodium ovale wallikeri]